MLQARIISVKQYWYLTIVPAQEQSPYLRDGRNSFISQSRFKNLRISISSRSLHAPVEVQSIKFLTTVAEAYMNGAFQGH